MLKIQMVDLKGQYDKVKPLIDKAIQDVIDESSFIKGTQVQLFEKNLASYLNVKHVISCANGTDALQIAMMALNLKPGDEIMVPAFTYVATAEVISLLGLTPILIDVDNETFCIDTKLIEEKITINTKAIVPVHLFGQCANMDEIELLAQKYNLFIIEDNAQALGASYTFRNNITKKAGTIGTIGITSFFPSKNLGCFGDGGALMTNDDNLAKKITMICNHGQSQKYVHDIIGVNSRLDTIQAAILNVKLNELSNYEKARNQVADLYDKLLGNNPKIKIPIRSPSSTHVFHQYTIKINPVERDNLKSELLKLNIPTMVYYPIALHMQKAFNLVHKNGRFPNSEELCKIVLSLPIHTEMNETQIEYIAQSINTILQ